MTAPYAFTPQIWPPFPTVVLLIALSLDSWLRRILPGTLALMFACLFATTWQIPTSTNAIRQKIGSSNSFDSNRAARPAFEPAQKRDDPSVSQTKRKDV